MLLIEFPSRTQNQRHARTRRRPLAGPHDKCGTIHLFMPRSSHLPIQLQPRDFTFLHGLFHSRVMTLVHATALYFDGKSEAAKKRVQKLKAAGYVRERPRQIYEPSVLFLTAQAFAVLSERGELAKYPAVSLMTWQKRADVSDLTLRHELEVMDVKAAFVSATASTDRLRVAEFSTWPLLSQFNACRPDNHVEVVVKPDGFIRVREDESDGAYEHAFFLEVDRSTESQEVLSLKAACYGDYYRRGGFAVRQGGERESYADYPFRVLMIFRNDERRNNTAERLLANNPPVRRQAMLTTMSEVMADPLGPIWVQPADYEEAVRGTAFDVHQTRAASAYRRQPEREELVQRSIVKRSLFSDEPQKKSDQH